MKDKILFVGGASLLAINWSYFVRNKYDIVLGLHKNVINVYWAKCLLLDFSKKESLKKSIKLINPKLIINCSGLTSVEYCEHNKLEANKVNSLLPKYISEICNELDIKFIHISTDHLFSGNQGNYTEDQMTDPVNYYGVSKRKGEINVIKSNNSALICRVNFYGWGTFYRKSFSDFIHDNLFKKKNIFLYTDVYYNPTLITHVADSIHKLIEKNESGIFNVVGSEVISKYNFGIKLAKTFDLDHNLINRISIDKRIELVRRPKNMSLNIDKLRETISYLSLSIDESLILLKNQQNVDRKKLYLK